MFSRRLADVFYRRMCCNVFLTNQIKGRCMSSSKTELSSDIQKMRTVKRITAGLLFAGTLATAVYVKKSRTKKLKFLLEDCQRLPTDENYGQGVEFFKCKGYVFPGELVKSGALKEMDNFQAKASDVFVVSFPKSGTTWVQEIVYLIETNLDFMSANARVLESRFPYLEYPFPGLRAIANQPEPRMIKSHLPFPLLPPTVKESGSKVIYITRDPRDVAVSYYHFLRMLKPASYQGTWDEYLSNFCQDRIPYTPYFDHVFSYWAQRDNPNVLLLRYENLHRDVKASIRQIAEFLGKPLNEEQVQLIAEHVSFQKMAKNPSVNYAHWDDLGLRNKNESPFMRKGQVGDWKNYFSPEQSQKFQEWMSHYSQNSDIAISEESRKCTLSHNNT